MNVKSVSSMIKQARSNATLYEEMLAAGYTDGEFPAWWFSPSREAEPRQDPAQRTLKQAQRTLTEAEVAEGAEDGRDTLGEEGYDPTPPRTPTPKEAEPGRPALKPASVPTAAIVPSEPSTLPPASATFSDAELSLAE